MARDFTANTSNYLSLGANALGPLLHGAATISFHVRMVLDTLPISGTAGRDLTVIEINSTTAGLAVSIFNSAGSGKLRAGGRSVSTDTFRTLDGATTLSLGTEYSVGVVWQIGSDTMRVYLDGVQDATGSSGTWANATYTNGTPTGHDGIGAAFTTVLPISTERQFDGHLSEYAWWVGDIGTAGFAQLAARYPAKAIRPDLLVASMRLLGNHSPETDEVGGLVGTITGTVAAAAHPRVFRQAQGVDFFEAPSAALGNLLDLSGILVRRGLRFPQPTTMPTAIIAGAPALLPSETSPHPRPRSVRRPDDSTPGPLLVPATALPFRTTVGAHRMA